ncbi:PAS domain S-box protein (plasmid) [Skermanella sp. TT6]|uniref:histidine kinase n=1 Tax=Skermanella cutis TaxID=2775420 RepID=A0ABX7BFD1_9PROT|nr:PAS domain S-box protein [Skermanella sp. TT6]
MVANAHLAAVVASSPDGIISFALDGTILTWNPGAERIFACTAEEAVGRSAGFLMPDDAGESPRRFGQAARGETISFELSGRREDGRHVDAMVTLAPMQAGDGSIVGVSAICRDVTEHRRMEAELRARDREFLAFFEQAAAGLAICDPDGRFLAVNDRYCQAVGRPRGELFGLRMHDITHPDDLPRNAVLFQHLVDGGEAFEIEKRYVRPDGSSVWANNSVSAIRDDAGRLTSVIAVSIDLTDRRRAEAALRESEARFRHMADSAPALIWMTDVEGSLTFANMHYDYLFGRPAADMLGEGWTAVVLPEDLEAYTGAFAAAFQARGPFRHETRVVDRRGQVRWLRCEGVARFDDYGEFLGYTGCSVDITDAKSAREELEMRVAERTEALAESERRFRTIFDSTFQFMALLAPDGTVEEVNRTAMAWSRIGPEDIVGRPFWLAAPMRGDPALQAAVRDAIRRAAAGEVVREEHGMRGAGDVRATIDFSVKPVHDGAGRLYHLIAEGRDVTEQKRASEQLRQAQKMEAIGQLTGGVAHDFNNLLQVLSGGLGMFDRSMEPARRQRLLDGMHQAVERGASLTRQLLAFSRRQPLRSEPVDLAGQIGGMRELLDRSLRGDIQIRTRFPPGLWPVEADPGELELVVLNLCVNARDAMPGGGTITLAARNAPGLENGDLRGDFVRLSVADDGTGMTPDVAARVFEPFFTTKEVGKGSGLGLAQAFGFAQASGGRVDIDTAPGRGTTVTVLLPRSAKAPNRPARPLLDPGELREIAALGHVLLVEDGDEVAALAEEMLASLGYEVTRVASAAAALGALADGRTVDAVFSDVMMPGGMSGVALARELRLRRPDLPVLLTTGYEASAAGAVAEGIRVIAKPYRMAGLAAALEAAIRGHKVPAPALGLRDGRPA